VSDLDEILRGHTAAIMDGHAVIAEAAAADLRAAGIRTATLDAIAAHYRKFAEASKGWPVSAIGKSARAHRAENRVQVAGLITIIALCTIAVVLLVIRFRLVLL